MSIHFPLYTELSDWAYNRLEIKVTKNKQKTTGMSPIYTLGQFKFKQLTVKV